jgi:hypothetical protein
LGAGWRIESDNDPPYVQLVASKGTTIAFHITLIWGEGDIEHALDICGQEVLHKSTGHEAGIFFAIYHSTTQMVYVRQMDPKTGVATNTASGGVQDKAALIKESITCLEAIVKAGWNNDRGTGTSEDDWNTDVQHALIKLALETCEHKATLNIYGVYAPSSCARSCPKLIYQQ